MILLVSAPQRSFPTVQLHPTMMRLEARPNQRLSTSRHLTSRNCATLRLQTPGYVLRLEILQTPQSEQDVANRLFECTSRRKSLQATVEYPHTNRPRAAHCIYKMKRVALMECKTSSRLYYTIIKYIKTVASTTRSMTIPNS